MPLTITSMLCTLLISRFVINSRLRTSPATCSRPRWRRPRKQEHNLFGGSAKTKKEIKGKDDEIAKLKAEIKRLNRKAYPGRYRLSSRAILTSLRVNRNTDSEAFDTKVDDIVFNQYMPQMDRHTLGEGERSASQPPRYSL